MDWVGGDDSRGRAGSAGGILVDWPSHVSWTSQQILNRIPARRILNRANESAAARAAAAGDD